MEMQNDSVVMDLSDCVLIDLNISAWTGRLCQGYEVTGG